MQLKTLTRGGKTVSTDAAKIKTLSSAVLHLHMTAAAAIDAAYCFYDCGVELPKGGRARYWAGQFRRQTDLMASRIDERSRESGRLYFYMADMRTKAAALSAKPVGELEGLFDRFLWGRLELPMHDALAKAYTALNVLFLHNEFARQWRRQVGADTIVEPHGDGTATIYDAAGDIAAMQGTVAEKAAANTCAELEKLAGIPEEWKNEDETKALQRQFRRVYSLWDSPAFAEKAIDFAKDTNRQHKT